MSNRGLLRFTRSSLPPIRQMPLRRAVIITLRRAIANPQTMLHSTVWGVCSGIAIAMFNTTLASRVIGFSGALIFAYLIGFTAAIPWRVRLVPPQHATLARFFLANGALGLMWGMALMFIAYLIPITLVVGSNALSLESLVRLLRSVPWGFVAPIAGYAIVDGEETASAARRMAARVRRRERLAEEARLVALRAQINPHFFFNALNTIAALIPTNPASAERAVELLAEALRPVLMREQPMLSPLASELRVARAYAEIEQLRFGDRVAVTFDIEPGSDGVMLPSLSLQPLLENAFRHGVGTTSERSDVVLSVRTGEGVLRICIDNNPGPARQDAAMAPVEMQPGHALNNITSRLAAHFAGRGALHVESDGRGRGRAVMTIPMEPKP